MGWQAKIRGAARGRHLPAAGAVLVFAILLSAPLGRAAEVQINVFGLFAPTELRLQAAGSQILHVTAQSSEARIEGGQTAVCRAADARVECSVGGSTIAGALVAVRGEGSAPAFRLSVPGKIARVFEGRLQLTAVVRTLHAVVAMDQETAVGSIVAAESPPDAAFEALKAQAVAARSYLRAGARHTSFDFCDTTHCQYLRTPPRDGHAARRAAAATDGLVLTHDGQTVRALYSRSCGGATRTLRQAGLQSDAYPYFSVACDSCLRQPETWQSTVDREVIQPVLENPTEAMRLDLARTAGWNALPSVQFRAEASGDSVTLHGTGRGHGIGLCQKGAAALALGGADFRAILRHYFPNTGLSGQGDNHSTSAF